MLSLLRTDPLLKPVCSRWRETGGDLDSQPTSSRLENAAISSPVTKWLPL
jgi:hypothetical protein